MNSRHISFRLLQVYITVLREGSISEAARQLHLTQPTVSLQLKKLRELVAEPLLEQHHGRWVATDAGLELYRAARDILGRFEDFDDYIRGLRGGQLGHFSIGLVNTAQYVLPRLLGPFSRRYPDIEVTVHVGNRRQMLQRFERQDADLFVFSHPPALEHAAAGRFLRNPLVLITPRNHPSLSHAPVRMGDLLKERFLLREPGSATRMMFESWLQEQGLTLGPTLQMASNEAIRIGVAAGMGLAVISEHVLAAGDAELAHPQVQGLPIESHWHFIARKDRRLPHAARSFLQFAATELDQCLPARFICNEIDTLLAQLEG